MQDPVEANANPLKIPITKLLVSLPKFISGKTKWNSEKNAAEIITDKFLLTIR
jgi:hypothetical protein